jgi:hypothetical protein
MNQREEWKAKYETDKATEHLLRSPSPWFGETPQIGATLGSG